MIDKDSPNIKKGSMRVLVVKGTPQMNMIPKLANTDITMVTTAPIPNKHLDFTLSYLQKTRQQNSETTMKTAGIKGMSNKMARMNSSS